MELDHFFILSSHPSAQAKILTDIGLVEGTPNIHPGQGTSNRRFFFSNSALELVYIRDAKEADAGPGRRLQLTDRAIDPRASPFGLIMRDGSSETDPFNGWLYQPDYFQQGYKFLVGENSVRMEEPLCIHMPFNLPRPANQAQADKSFSTVTELRVHVPVSSPSDVLKSVSKVKQITLITNAPHLLEVVFNNEMKGKRRDLRPMLPLLLRW